MYTCLLWSHENTETETILKGFSKGMDMYICGILLLVVAHFKLWLQVCDEINFVNLTNDTCDLPPGMDMSYRKGRLIVV